MPGKPGTNASDVVCPTVLAPSVGQPMRLSMTPSTGPHSTASGHESSHASLVGTRTSSVPMSPVRPHASICPGNGAATVSTSMLESRQDPAPTKNPADAPADTPTRRGRTNTGSTPNTRGDIITRTRAFDTTRHTSSPTRQIRLPSSTHRHTASSTRPAARYTIIAWDSVET